MTDAAEKGKKQLLLRLSSRLHQELAAWAEEDFRSLNGQIEYLLTQALRRRKKSTLPEEGAQGAEADGQEGSGSG